MAVKDVDDWDNDFDSDDEFNDSRQLPRNTVVPPPRASARAKGDISKLTVEQVKAAVIGSVGDIDSIAATLGVDRVALRRYINGQPDIKEAIEDEILSARERVIKQTYDDAINGSQTARQDFFKMTGGMFDKKEEKAAETQQLVIKFTAPQQRFKVLNPDTGETGVVGRNLRPVEDDGGETIDADYADGSPDGDSSGDDDGDGSDGGISDTSTGGI